FAGTRRAHGKVRHRSVDTIIGNLFHDGKAGSAVRTVREGITKSPLLRIQHFVATGCTNRSIGSYARAVLATDTFRNAEVIKVQQGQDLRLHILDLRQRGCLAVQSGKKLRDGARISGGSD